MMVKLLMFLLFFSSMDCFGNCCECLKKLCAKRRVDVGDKKNNDNVDKSTTEVKSPTENIGSQFQQSQIQQVNVDINIINIDTNIIFQNSKNVENNKMNEEEIITKNPMIGGNLQKNVNVNIISQNSKNVENNKMNEEETLEEKRIDLLCQAVGIDPNNLLARMKTKQDMYEFDKKIKEQEEKVDKNNLYINSSDDEYYKKVDSQNFGSQNNIIANASGVPVVDPQVEILKYNGAKRYKEFLEKTLDKQFVKNYPEAVKDNFVIFKGEEISKENTFNCINFNFLDKMKGNKLSFIWDVNKVLLDNDVWGDSLEGPSRQLLSTFYTNLVRSNLSKLDRLFVNSVDYVVFKKNLTKEDCSVLGQLAFMSFLKMARFEYNFPETYYKIMLHKKDEKLEDYLSLADLKTMLSILHESKEGKTIYGRMRIPINIEINPNKDDVLLKYAKEEVYKIYCKMHYGDKEDERKTFKDFGKNYEDEISKLMFDEGVNIKDLLQGFLQGFYNRGILAQKNQKTKSFYPFDNFLKTCFYKPGAVAKGLQIYFQGEPVDSVDAFMEHVELSKDFSKNTIKFSKDTIKFSKDTIKTVLTNFINTNYGTDKKKIRKFFENVSCTATGSIFLFGSFAINVWKPKGNFTTSNFWCSTCDRTLYLNPAFGYSEAFKSFLEYAKTLENVDFMEGVV